MDTRMIMFMITVLSVGGWLIYKILVKDGCIKPTYKNLLKTILIVTIGLPLLIFVIICPTLGIRLGSGIVGLGSSASSKSPRSHYRKGTTVHTKNSTHYRSDTYVNGSK